MNDPIKQFQGKYRFLSNFFIEPDGTHVEGEYQSQKCSIPTDTERFRGLSPGQCKRLVRTVKLRSDWERSKVVTMRLLVHQKFVDHPGLADDLLATGDVELIEGNSWGDSFWGVVNNGNGHGRNELGKILMHVRKDLKDVRPRRP